MTSYNITDVQYTSPTTNIGRLQPVSVTRKCNHSLVLDSFVQPLRSLKIRLCFMVQLDRDTKRLENVRFGPTGLSGHILIFYGKFPGRKHFGRLSSMNICVASDYKIKEWRRSISRKPTENDGLHEKISPDCGHR